MGEGGEGGRRESLPCWWRGAACTRPSLGTSCTRGEGDGPVLVCEASSGDLAHSSSGRYRLGMETEGGRARAQQPAETNFFQP